MRLPHRMPRRSAPQASIASGRRSMGAPCPERSSTPQWHPPTPGRGPPRPGRAAQLVRPDRTPLPLRPPSAGSGSLSAGTPPPRRVEVSGSPRHCQQPGRAGTLLSRRSCSAARSSLRPTGPHRRAELRFTVLPYNGGDYRAFAPHRVNVDSLLQRGSRFARVIRERVR